MLEWFNASEAEKLGQTLAQIFMKTVPSTAARAKAKGLEKQFKVEDRIDQQIEQFKRGHKLNVYKKAKLGARFKEELLKAGYDRALVEDVTLGLMQKL